MVEKEIVESDSHKFKQLLAHQKSLNGKPYIDCVLKQNSQLRSIANEFIFDVFMAPSL